ncbi:unnamed protein product [Hermetia illucens]|uniref:Hcy-binding domain-containing protein n=1 Tax=Hermetia illucens TaxID=343691 RepID=A0A7R8UFE3_HERIL|nr:homocysteine S-methyltransferase 1-like [Hermetia illucens]XP_037926850.1 homocysteine S-methyltransferase 1-like [Hermetia illucens]XP_037926851.1 homocysteine S-methyltransferase 1-like [Hermetia illucens]CAD7079599.1 unnamed protein product [Hermetia illucens]
MANKVLIKNSGFAQQLAKNVGTKIDGDPLWCARFNATNPDAVIQTYLDGLEDGADIISTNTYQASVDGYMQYLSLTKEESIELIKKTVKHAHTAREKWLAKIGKTLEENNGFPLISGSVGAYGAHLHDGSEYTGDYADTVDADTFKKWHKMHIDAILDVGVDCLCIETIPCQAESKAIIEMLCDDYPDVKFWITHQCKDDKNLAHGEPLGEVCQMIWDHLKARNLTKNCYAVGANCVKPKFVTSLFKSVNGGKKPEEYIPLVVYPTSGETYEKDIGWVKKGDCPPIEGFIPEWVALGLRILGGGCRTSSKDAQKFKDVLEGLNK